MSGRTFNKETYDSPFVSVVVPLYNNAEFVSDSISSVLSGKYSNLEVIVIDDCSTDRGVDIIEDIMSRDDRVKLITSAQNSGVAASRNLGIDRSQGKYIAFLDSDDFWHENKLSDQINFMVQNSVGFSYTGYNVVNRDGAIVSRINVPKIVNFRKMTFSNWIGCSTVVVSRSVLQDRRFNNITKREDYLLWLEILSESDYAYGLNKPMVSYRRHGAQNSAHKINMASENFALYLRVFDGNYFKATFSFIFYMFFGIIKAIKILFFDKFVNRFNIP
jgi:teichuronic acid biosynthesis glycosyltransferase TuaG